MERRRGGRKDRTKHTNTFLNFFSSIATLLTEIKNQYSQVSSIPTILKVKEAISEFQSGKDDNEVVKGKILFVSEQVTK